MQRTIWPPRIRVVAEVSSAAAGKRRRGNITPRVSDSVPARSFYDKGSLFKGFNTFFMEDGCFLFLSSHATRPVMFASAESVINQASAVTGGTFREPPSRAEAGRAEPSRAEPSRAGPGQADQPACVVPGGLTLGFPRITARNDQRSVTAHISCDGGRGVGGGDHTLLHRRRKKATRNASREPECPLVRYHHPRTEVM